MADVPQPPSDPAAASPPVVHNADVNDELLQGANRRDIARMTQALDGGADVNTTTTSGRSTALHLITMGGIATDYKVLPIVRLLITRRANVNLQNGTGVTPLMYAVLFKNIEVMKVLLDAGADRSIRRPSGGETALDFARQGGFAEGVRLLEEEPAPAPAPARVPNPEQDRALESAIGNDDDAAARSAILSGANPNHVSFGDTEPVLIHYAATDNRAMVEFLLSRGADVNARAGPGGDEPGGTAMDYTTDDDMRAILRAAGGRTQSELDAAPSPAPEGVSRPVLSGRSDLKIPAIWVRDDYRSAMTEGVDWEVIDIPEIFVAKLGRDLTLDQFFRKYMGDGIVFKVGAKFYGVERKDLVQEYSEGSAIAYECTKTFIYNPTAVPPMYGTFEYSDIYATPYFALRTPAGVLYTDLLSAVDMLSRPHAFYKVGTDPVKKLENVASRSSVLLGGPVVSQLHCQAGSGENVYEISPFRLPEIKDDDEDSEEEEEPNVFYVKKGEEKTEFPLDLSQTVLQVKEAVKEKLGIAVESQKMVFQGKVLKDEQTLGDAKVGKGYTIQLQVIGGRRFTRKQCKKFTCAKMGFTQKASCRPYKNCYRSTAGVQKKRGTHKRHSRK
jgi:ankyrin repeat protein